LQSAARELFTRRFFLGPISQRVNANRTALSPTLIRSGIVALTAYLPTT
jgi:hypothetical protein